MNALQNIAGHTAINCPMLNDSLADISGNGLHLAGMDVITRLPATPTWTNVTSTFRGVDLGVTTTTMLKAPVSALLQFTGPCTFEWVMAQRYTFVSTYFACADPTPPGRDAGFGNGAPDIKGSLYTIFWSAFGHPAISDQFYGGGGGTTSGRDFTAGDTTTWADIANPWVFSVPHLFAVTRDAAGTWRAYRDGVSIGPAVPSLGTNVKNGLEQLFIGGTEIGTSGGPGWFGGFRALDVALTAPQLVQDAVYVLGPAAAHDPMPSALAKSAATGNVYRHRPKSFGDQFYNPGQS